MVAIYFHLLFLTIHLSFVFGDADINSFTNEQGRHAIHEGLRKPGDKHLFAGELIENNEASKRSMFSKRIGHLYCYPQQGQMDKITVTEYEVRDLEYGIETGLAYDVSGGVGEGQVCIYVVTRSGGTFRYRFDVWGTRDDEMNVAPGGYGNGYNNVGTVPGASVPTPSAGVAAPPYTGAPPLYTAAPPTYGAAPPTYGAPPPQPPYGVAPTPYVPPGAAPSPTVGTVTDGYGTSGANQYGGSLPGTGYPQAQTGNGREENAADYYEKYSRKGGADNNYRGSGTQFGNAKVPPTPASTGNDPYGLTGAGKIGGQRTGGYRGTGTNNYEVTTNRRSGADRYGGSDFEDDSGYGSSYQGNSRDSDDYKYEGADAYDGWDKPGYGSKSPGYGNKSPGYGDSTDGYGDDSEGYGSEGYGATAQVKARGGQRGRKVPAPGYQYPKKDQAFRSVSGGYGGYSQK